MKTPQLISSAGKTKPFPLLSGTQEGCPLPSFYLTQQWKSYPQKQTTTKNKRIPVGEEEVKHSLFTDNMTLYIKNSRLHQNIARTDTQIQQSHKIQYQHTEIGCISTSNNEETERKIKKTIHPVYNCTKYNRIPKELQYLYSEDSKNGERN